MPWLTRRRRRSGRRRRRRNWRRRGHVLPQPAADAAKTVSTVLLLITALAPLPDFEALEIAADDGWLETRTTGAVAYTGFQRPGRSGRGDPCCDCARH